MALRTNYIRHLNAFFAQVRQDDRLHANHISLYLALFQVWNQYRFENPFPILREEAMCLSRIGSRSTYIRCLKQLHEYGYITYQPIPQRYAPSLIKISKLVAHTADPNVTQLSLFHELKVGDIVLEPENVRPNIGPHIWPKNEPGLWLKSGPQQGPKVGRIYYKHLNDKKREREKACSPIKKNRKNEVKNQYIEPAAGPSTSTPPATPTLAQVQQFFQEASYPDKEALKFFYHYKANGWHQGEKTPITDWQAAGHKWMLNVKPQKTESNDIRNTRSAAQPGRLHANEDKSYSDPL